MKTTLKFAVLILSILTVNSCVSKGEVENIENKETGTKQEIPESSDPVITGGFYPFYSHIIYLRFQDTLGNDLLEGKESTFPCVMGQRQTAKPEFYTLDVVFEDGIYNEWKPAPAPLIGGMPAYILDERYPAVYFNLYPEYTDEKYDYNSLFFTTQSDRPYGEDATLHDAKFAEKITFRFTCPDLFGDDEVHEIITWWEPRGEGFHTKCTCITYDGKEFPVKDEYAEQPIATIILDK